MAVGLGLQQKLHCQFAVDHKRPAVTVQWHWNHRGDRRELFSYVGQSGQTHGSGVGLKSLAGGDATLNLPFTKLSSEGTYVCSVSVDPLFASLDISLRIEGENELQSLIRRSHTIRTSAIGRDVFTGVF